MIELKSCPFCGGKAQIDKKSKDFYFVKIDHIGECYLDDIGTKYIQNEIGLNTLFREWNTRSSVSVDKINGLISEYKNIILNNNDSIFIQEWDDFIEDLEQIK